ncbi:hypothetical protein [Frigoribacterium faeni]|uniref:Non-ribosomal peptide synthetase component F n=1 Tax=Frigoribacterium faeni TaxID=145483 RepID=A0A7W3JGR8_9MICO|nr:hypothetical protein [Frigoribacterium faeni]MBA8812498.1 non-ribosomal peptide synthetase component F [Frigoribacterium faeni]BFF13590.1 hypothetical protein GCM10025699_48930 [Microbacterium flavescens]GEK81785.1 hypothetical protein FFA01_00940 [Frigoribacterium faeni]
MPDPARRIRRSPSEKSARREGITAETVDDVAAELTEGETYVFSVGSGSLRIERLLDLVRQEPPVYDVAPAS